MKFSEKMQEMINKGMAATRDLASKASEKAKDLGAMGVVKLEIMQLRGQAEKLIAKLGSEVYKMLVEANQETVSRESPSINSMLRDIEDLRAKIEQKEAEYRSIGGKEEV